MSTGAGSFTDDAPIAYQEVDGVRVPVTVAYSLEPAGSGTVVGYTLGAYDRDLPLVIDPSVFVYLGFFGGNGYDAGASIAVDGSGNAYVTGYVHPTRPFPVGPVRT